MSNRWFIDVTLEKQLTKEETKENFIKYRNGEISAREKLILHNLRLVLYEVNNKFFSAPFDKDELVSVGMIGLIKAIDAFNLDKKIEFTTFAATCIDNEIKMYIRKNKKYLINESFDSIIDEETEFKLEKILYDENADFVSKYEDKELKENIFKIIDSLSEIDSKIMKLNFGFYGERYTQKEIATIINYSQSYISRIIKKNTRLILNILYEQNLVESKAKIKRS